MRRLVAIVAFASIVAASPARADDDPKAVADYKTIEEWVGSQQPKTAEERKAFRTECEKRFRAFLKDHPDGGSPTRSVKGSLADVLYNSDKFDESLKLWEEILKAPEEDQHPRARYGIIRDLVGKKDVKGARARLDGFLKEHPDEETLRQADEYLKRSEDYTKRSDKGKALKVGDEAPAIKLKIAEDKEIDLAAYKGKAVLLHFWTSEKRVELADIKKLYADLHAKGLEVLGLDLFEKDWEAYKKVVEKEQIAWPLVTQKDAKSVAQSYGVTTFPRVVLVGKDGKVLSLSVPYSQLAESVKAAVDGKPLPKPKAPEGKPATSGDE
jgi:peroxiredoxin